MYRGELSTSTITLNDEDELSTIEVCADAEGYSFKDITFKFNSGTSEAYEANLGILEDPAGCSDYDLS